MHRANGAPQPQGARESARTQRRRQRRTQEPHRSHLSLNAQEPARTARQHEAQRRGTRLPLARPQARRRDRRPRPRTPAHANERTRERKPRGAQPATTCCASRRCARGSRVSAQHSSNVRRRRPLDHVAVRPRGDHRRVVRVRAQPQHPCAPAAQTGSHAPPAARRRPASRCRVTPHPAGAPPPVRSPRQRPPPPRRVPKPGPRARSRRATSASRGRRRRSARAPARSCGQHTHCGRLEAAQAVPALLSARSTTPSREWGVTTREGFSEAPAPLSREPDHAGALR